MKNKYLITNLVIALTIFVFGGQNIVKAQSEQPILVVDAGVLPNSKFYFLDRFDEWMQENVFTFGVNSLRSEAALANASERVSEAQILNAQGLLSNRLANQISLEWQKNLFLAANIAGSETEKGGNPTRLMQQTLDALFLGEKALDEEIKNSILLTPDDYKKLEEYLWETEKKTLLLIHNDDSVDLKPAMETLTKGLIYFSEKNIADEKRSLEVNNDDGKIQFAGPEMIAVAEKGIEQAKKFVENGDYKNALDEMDDIRSAIHLSGVSTLSFDKADSSDGVTIMNRIGKAEETVANSGLLDAEIIEKARKNVMDELNTTK
jgi:hypothetical protein